MMHLIPIFKFTLGQGQSISPAALQALWADACESKDVSVGRQPPSFRGNGKPTYALYASPSLANMREIERRLRERLEASHLRASLIALHS